MTNEQKAAIRNAHESMQNAADLLREKFGAAAAQLGREATDLTVQFREAFKPRKQVSASVRHNVSGITYEFRLARQGTDEWVETRIVRDGDPKWVVANELYQVAMRVSRMLSAPCFYADE